MATHEGSHFDSFKKLCDAVDYFIDRHFKSWIFNGKESVNIEFFYPVLILQGELLEGIPSKRSLSFRASNHLQYRRPSIIRGQEIEFQIDVIREPFLPTYLSIVNEEIKKTAHLLRQRHKIVRESIDTIVENARKLKEPERRRFAMDFQR